MTPNYFLKMLEHLRANEEVVLFSDLLSLEDFHITEVEAWLLTEYQKEGIEYPIDLPPFDAAAAIWGAKTTYSAAILILNRENSTADIEQMLPPFTGEMKAGTILSADLTLRFLPAIVACQKMIDSEDILIQLIEKILIQWHYSGISATLPQEKLDFTFILDNPTVKRMYLDRILQFQHISLAGHPLLKAAVQSDLGIYAAELWEGFNYEYNRNEKY